MKQQLKKNKSNKLTNWANEPTYQDLRNDLDASSGFVEDYRAKLLEWDELRDGGKEIIPSRPGKSTARPKVIRKNNEWKYPSLEDPFLNTSDLYEIRPRTWEDVESAKQNELLLNYQWSVELPKVKIVNDVVRYLVDEGTCVVKVGWEIKEEIKTELQEQPVYADPETSLALMVQMVQAGKMSEQEMQMRMQSGEPMQIGVEHVEVEVRKLVKNQPKIEVCNNANIRFDPTCEGVIENANFAIYEYDTNIAELKAEEYIKDLETGEVSGVYHNLDKIKKNDDGSAIYDEHKSDQYNDFKFADKARKKLTAYEYWGYWDINGDDVLVPIVATWVGDVLIRLEENPFPHKRIPFALATYMPIKKEVMGEPDAEILKENQESIGKLTRAAHDITSEQAVGQEFIDETFFPTPSQQNQYEKGNTVYYRAGMDPKRAIYKKSIDPVPSSVFNMIQWQQADAESLSGTKAFSGGISGAALGDSVGGVRSALDATSKRELSILRRLSEMFKDIASMIIPMNQAYLEPKKVIRVTNSEFITIDREEIGKGLFDLIVDVSTPEKDEDTANKLMTLLQTNAASMDPAEARIIRSKMARLWKQPDLAKQIEEFKPEPDPIQQEMMMVQLEEAKLKLAIARKSIEEMDSRIVERVSRSEENQYDRIKKDAQAKEALANAERAMAQAEKLREEADAIAADFVKEMSGQKRREYEMDKEFDALVQEKQKQSKM